MRVLLLVLVVLLGLAALQIGGFLLLVRTWRASSATFFADLKAEAQASGERFVLGPERAVYRGGSKPYSAVKGNGTIVLTDRRLVFRKLTGPVIEVPRSKISGTRQSAGFRGARTGGMTHLVLATTDPAEVVFFVQDISTWERALDGAGAA